MAFIGPGPEWFWTALSGIILAVTVEQIDRAEAAWVFAEAVALGLPVFVGEHYRRGGGYHHYPNRNHVAAWLAAERLEVVAEGHSRDSDYSYCISSPMHALDTERTRRPPLVLADLLRDRLRISLSEARPRHPATLQ